MERSWNQRFSFDGFVHDSLEPKLTMLVDTGHQLCEARKKLNLTVTDVANALKLNETVIEAIEERQYDKLYGVAYATGYVRAYASLVKLDPNELIQNDPDLGLVGRSDRMVDENLSPQPTKIRPITTSWAAIAFRSVIIVSIFVVVIVGWTMRDDLATWWNQNIQNEKIMEVQKESTPDNLKQQPSNSGITAGTRAS